MYCFSWACGVFALLHHLHWNFPGLESPEHEGHFQEFPLALNGSTKNLTTQKVTLACRIGISVFVFPKSGEHMALSAAIAV